MFVLFMYVYFYLHIDNGRWPSLLTVKYATVEFSVRCVVARAYTDRQTPTGTAIRK